MNNIVENAQAQIDPSVILQLLSAIQPPQYTAGGVGGPQRAPNPMASPPTAAPVRPQAPVAGPVTPPNFMEAGGKRFEYPAVRKTATTPQATPQPVDGAQKMVEVGNYLESRKLKPEERMRLRAKASSKLINMGVDKDTLMRWVSKGNDMNLPQYLPSGYTDTEGRQLRMSAKKKKLEIMLKPDKDGNLSDDQFQAVKQDLIDAGMKEEDITTGKGAAFLGLGERGGKWRLTPKAKAKYTEMIMQEGSSGGGGTATPPSPTAPQGSFSEDEMMKMMNALK